MMHQLQCKKTDVRVKWAQGVQVHFEGEYVKWGVRRFSAASWSFGSIIVQDPNDILSGETNGVELIQGTMLGVLRVKGVILIVEFW